MLMKRQMRGASGKAVTNIVRKPVWNWSERDTSIDL